MTESELTNILLKSNRVKFYVSAHPETIPIKGNCSAIDEITDKETENWIINELNNGNIWAWCSIEVTAQLDESLSGHDYLGCCSYLSEQNFIDSNNYYADMKYQACFDLACKLLHSKKLLDSFN